MGQPLQVRIVLAMPVVGEDGEVVKQGDCSCALSGQNWVFCGIHR